MVVKRIAAFGNYELLSDGRVANLRIGQYLAWEEVPEDVQEALGENIFDGSEQLFRYAITRKLEPGNRCFLADKEVLVLKYTGVSATYWYGGEYLSDSYQHALDILEERGLTITQKRSHGNNQITKIHSPKDLGDNLLEFKRMTQAHRKYQLGK